MEIMLKKYQLASERYDLHNKEKGLYQNKVNSSLVYTYNCKMVY